MHTNPCTERDPASLHLHQLYDKLPAPLTEGGRWDSFKIGLSAAGPDKTPPIFVTKLGKIVKGRRRWLGAKQMQWDRLRVIEVPDEEAAVTHLDALFGSHDMTRGAKVYLALALLPEYARAAEARRNSNARKDVKTFEKSLNSFQSSNFTGIQLKAEILDPLVQRWGVSRETVFRALRVRKLFAANPAYREQYEADLLCGEKNLWNIESAIGGKETDQSHRQTEFNFSAALPRILNTIELPAGRKALLEYLDSVEDDAELARLRKFGHLIESAAEKRAAQLRRAA